MASKTEEAPLDLKWKSEETGTWKKKLTIEIAAAEISRRLDKACKELAGEVQLPGFRKGRAPVNVVERRFAVEIAADVRRQVVPAAVQQACKDGNLKPINVPGLDIEKIQIRRGEPLAFDVEIEVQPEFTVGQYKGLEATQTEVEVFDDEVAAEIRRLLASRGKFEDAPAEAKVQIQDILHGTMKVEVDGKEVSSEQDTLAVTEDMVLGVPGPVTAAAFVGKAAGETVECDTELGGEYREAELRGKKARVRFAIEKIRRFAEAPLTDELAKEAGAESAADLREKVRARLQEALGEQSRRDTEAALVDKVIAATPFDLPEGVLARQADMYREYSHNLLERAGVAPEEIEKREGEFDEAAKAGATREVRKFFILRKIAEAEGLKTEDEEVEAEVAKMARARKVRATDLFHQLEEEEELPKIRADIEQRKALDFLVQQANIKVVPRERKKTADAAPGSGSEAKDAAPGAGPGQPAPAAAKPDVPEGT